MSRRDVMNVIENGSWFDNVKLIVVLIMEEV